MIDTCPHCQKTLNLTDSQKVKIQTALDKLPPGNLLKLGCPHCQSPFELKPDGSLPGQQIKKTGPASPKGATARKVNIPPPPPPDLGWLSSGKMQEKVVIEDTPMVLILMDKGAGMTSVREAYEDETFLPVFAESIDKALENMQFTQFSAVALHSGFGGSALGSNKLHLFMQKMEMIRRRNIHYTLIGPEFKTLYDLEALSYSANLVVNDADLNHFRIILKKSLHENQKLFGPLADAMVAQGRITGSMWLDMKIKAEQKMKSAVLQDLLEAKS